MSASPDSWLHGPAALAEALLPRLLAAGLQSLLFVALAWLLCRWMPRLSAAARCWLWWAAGLQLLLGLAWPAPLELAWLPEHAPATAQALATAAPPSPQMPVYARLPYALTGGEGVAAAVAPAADAALRAWLPSWPVALLSLWLAASAAGLASAWRGWRAVRRRVRAAPACDDPAVLAAWRSLGRSLGLRRLPALRWSEDIESPQLLGPWPAAVLLPRHRVAAMNPAELEMALHHELTHLRRGDLWWGLVPALAQRLFCFHPLAHLIAREYAIAREAACDAQVLASRRYAPQAYGRLLLRLGVAERPVAGVAGASPTYSVLKRRLTMLQDTASPSHLGSLCLAAALVAVGLVPYRVTAAAQERGSVSIHDSGRAGETRITELGGGDVPLVWAIKDGQYFRVHEDGRYEPVRDAATRQRLDQRQRDAAAAQAQAAVAARQAETATRAAAEAMRAAGLAADEAESAARQAGDGAGSEAGKQAAREAGQASAQAQRERDRAQRQADQAQRQAEQARNRADAARSQAEHGRQAAERARREAAQERQQARQAAQASRDASHTRDAAQVRQAAVALRGDAERMRRDALRAAEQTLREGGQIRRHALRAAEQAVRASAQALRDSERARRAAEPVLRDRERIRREALRAAEAGLRAAREGLALAASGG